MNTSVPIATLAGITSLTDLLPELPLPTPSSAKRKETLLHSPKVAEEAREILTRPDHALVQQLSQALQISKSTTDQLTFKDDVRQDDNISYEEGPLLLQAIFSQTPKVFSHPVNTLTECYQDPKAYSPAGYNHFTNHHRVSPTKVRSPLYAGSPGSAQPQSPYQQAVQHSPSDHVGRVHQMAAGPHQVTIQNRPTAYSQYTGMITAVQPNIGNPIAENPLLVNGSSPTAHLMQLSPTQTLSPLKTRRMRQGLSNSEPQLKTKQDIPDLNHGAVTAPHQKKGQRKFDLPPAVRRNLNDQEFYRHATQSQVQNTSVAVYNQVEYDSMSALQALVAQNGFNFDASVLGQASQQLDALTEKQRIAYSGTVEQPKAIHHQEVDLNRTSSCHSKPKKRRKSSRSKAEVDVENNGGQISDCVSQVESSGTDSQLPDPKCSQQWPSKLSWRSVEEQNAERDIIGAELMNEGQTLEPMSAMDLNIQNHWTPNRTDKPMSPNDGCEESCKSLSPTLELSPTLKGIQLYVPKLVITKIKQRRGSKEVETHQVREVIPGSESELERMKKRRRSSEEKSNYNRSHDLEEGVVLIKLCIGNNNICDIVVVFQN